MPDIRLSVNRRPRTLDVDPAMPLLWALRDHLGLFGTRFGCGTGTCGACTVHLGGQAVRSCVVPVSGAAGQEVTTIEGLSDRGTHPCQLAWLDEDVAQCGYCQPGMIMEAAALLARSSAPTDAEIDRVFTAHICRCGTYNRIRAAVHHAATLARRR